ncbi:histidine phosphatase family protein [Paenibacillus polygoni]|uniref:Histidine phosphatase family protein n=1 Tax=Paenibacillus polygoni TaxID=3050112 RepID=A0ABY8X8B2_9BACL|nr:histidine phosphatase family protein [Paenibacillus polygoni]WIV20199.1 histidine phosphatase family protein [Paenibacillus polygoni]
MSTPQNNIPSVDVYLVRHGLTIWNQQRRYLGHTDLPLLPKAKEELAGLRTSLRHIQFEQIYGSDLIRCIETLDIIVPEQAHRAVLDARLREYHFGEYEGQTYEMLQHDPKYRQWIDNPLGVTPPGAETFSHFSERIEKFVEERMGPYLYGSRRSNDQDRGDDNEVPKMLVVTHGGVIRQWTAKWLAEAEFNSFMPRPGECLVLRFTLSGGELSVQKIDN